MRRFTYQSGVIALALLFSACSTMYFVQQPLPQDRPAGNERWHHVGVLDLVEFSNPVALQNACDNRGAWRYAKVEKGPIQVLAHIGASFVLAGAYDPWAVTVSCTR
jgi:hypothetical protein